MMSLTAILDCGVKVKVELVGLPFFRLLVVLVSVKVVSSRVLVKVTSVSVDCSIKKPSLA